MRDNAFKDKKIKRDQNFKKKYKRLGHFYDHKHNTVGFVYEEKQLYKFVKKHKKDPPEIEVAVLPKNCSDWFALQFSQQGVFAFWAKPKLSEKLVVLENYDRFEVYATTEAKASFQALMK